MTARPAKPFHSTNHPYSKDGGKVMLYKGTQKALFEADDEAKMIAEGWKDNPTAALEAEKPKRGRPPKTETEE